MFFSFHLSPPHSGKILFWNRPLPALGHQGGVSGGIMFCFRKAVLYTKEFDQNQKPPIS